MFRSYSGVSLEFDHCSEKSSLSVLSA
jgi:hypothetical protein